MKTQHLILKLALSVLFAGTLFGQTNADESIIAGLARDISLYSTANLFDKTNIVGRPIMSSLDGSQTNIVLIVCHLEPCPIEYTNIISNTNLFSPTERNLLQDILVKYSNLNENKSDSVRVKPGDGYDVNYDPMSQTATLVVQQIKHGRLNGLRIEFHGSHCCCLLRFVDDRAVGKWFEWDTQGELLLEAEFKEPYNIVGNLNFGPPR